IGAAIARRLAAAGARVGVFDLDGHAAETVASEISGVPLTGDVTREFDIESALAHLAAEAGPVDILVNNAGIIGKVGPIADNSISPAVIHTPMMDALPAATQEYMVSRVPLGRPGTSEEVAALVHYLASSEASFTTGQCYDISGGRATY